MKTMHHIASISFVLFLSNKLSAQNSLDGRDIAFPDRESLLQWLSTDGMFTLVLVISLVSLLIWVFYLVGTFFITMESTNGQQVRKNRPGHALPEVRLPRVEIGLFNQGGINAGLVPAKGKKKKAPDSSRENSETDTSTRG